MGAAVIPLNDLPPPDPVHLVPIVHEVPLSRGRYLLDRQHQYRGRIAWFSLQLSATIDGLPEVIARVDTSRGTVHMTTFAPGGVEETAVIERIPAESASDFLDNAYLAAYDHLVSGADQLIKAWEGARPPARDDLGTIP
jgi:predicted ThiF/HesA family dinucleotide-utilizing enzyme